MTVGSIGAGRVGLAALRRLVPFGVKLCYSDPHRLSPQVEKELGGAVYYENHDDLVKNVDALLVNAPLHPGTERMFDAKLIASMRRGSYIVNNARGKLMVTQAVVDGASRCASREQELIRASRPLF